MTPEEKNRIRLEKLKVKFQQGFYEQVLFEALSCIPDDDGRIWRWVQENYIEPFQKEHQKMREVNAEAFKEYPYLYGEIGPAPIQILWQQEDGYFVFQRQGQVFIYQDDFKIHTKDRLLITNPLNIGELLAYKKSTEYHGRMPHYKEPVYIYYDPVVFDALVQCFDFRVLLEENRTILLIGEENVRIFFEDLQVRMPAKILGNACDKIGTILEQVGRERIKSEQLHIQQSEEYYKSSVSERKERVERREPRILFLTCRFTNVVKYHTRDCKKAAEKLGLETELLIEREDFFSVTPNVLQESIAAFRPDMIFMIDHFRFEYPDIPKEIIWICWAQDGLHHIMSKQTPVKLGNRDFILNHFITWDQFKQVGYPPEVLIDAPIPANADVYRPYELTKEEYNSYACDICLVCHASDADARRKSFIDGSGYSKELKSIVTQIYKGYQCYVYESGEPFYTQDTFEEFVRGSLRQCFSASVSERIVSQIAENMFSDFNPRVFRQALADWLIDAGFTSMKLWGNGWKDNEKYRAYAMGSAENGETLSKIYQASKIVVGNNVITTSAARAWETMLSGGFYLSNYIPEEDDATDIRKIIEVGKDVIMFRNRDDLIEKLHYYLEHEKERQIMIERGRKAALESMTFDRLMKRTLSEVAKRLEESNNG